MLKPLKSIIKILLTAIGAAFGIILQIALPIILWVIIMVDHRPIPTDAEMIKRLESNETLFAELCSMIKNDTLSHFPFTESEKRNSIIFHISVERELEYDSLMKELHIYMFHYFSPYGDIEKTGTNSIIFYYFGKGFLDGYYKGFEYVFDRTKEKDKEFTRMELKDAVSKKCVDGYCEYYKKINDRWNLFIQVL